MSMYQFISGNVPFKPYRGFLELSVKAVKEQGIILPDTYTLDTKLLIFEPEQDGMFVRPHGISLYGTSVSQIGQRFTDKKYHARLQIGICSEQPTMQFIEYIKRHLKEDEEVEMWDVWPDHDYKESAALRYCDISSLAVDHIRALRDHDGFYRPCCLTIHR